MSQTRHDPSLLASDQTLNGFPAGGLSSSADTQPFDIRTDAFWSGTGPDDSVNIDLLQWLLDEPAAQTAVPDLTDGLVGLKMYPL